MLSHLEEKTIDNYRSSNKKKYVTFKEKSINFDNALQIKPAFK